MISFVKQKALHASEMMNDKANTFLWDESSDGDRSRIVGICI